MILLPPPGPGLPCSRSPIASSSRSCCTSTKLTLSSRRAPHLLLVGGCPYPAYHHDRIVRGRQSLDLAVRRVGCTSKGRSQSALPALAWAATRCSGSASSVDLPQQFLEALSRLRHPQDHLGVAGECEVGKDAPGHGDVPDHLARPVKTAGQAAADGLDLGRLTGARPACTGSGRAGTTSTSCISSVASFVQFGPERSMVLHYPDGAGRGQGQEGPVPPPDRPRQPAGGRPQHRSLDAGPLAGCGVGAGQPRAGPAGLPEGRGEPPGADPLRELKPWASGTCCARPTGPSAPTRYAASSLSSAWWRGWRRSS